MPPLARMPPCHSDCGVRVGLPSSRRTRRRSRIEIGSQSWARNCKGPVRHARRRYCRYAPARFRARQLCVRGYAMQGNGYYKFLRVALVESHTVYDIADTSSSNVRKVAMFVLHVVSNLRPLLGAKLPASCILKRQESEYASSSRWLARCCPPLGEHDAEPRSLDLQGSLCISLQRVWVSTVLLTI